MGIGNVDHKVANGWGDKGCEHPQKNQCAYCKEMGYWKKEYTQKDKRNLEMAEMSLSWQAQATEGGGFEVLLEFWVTLQADGKPVNSFSGHWSHHSVLKTSVGPLSDKQTGSMGNKDGPTSMDHKTNL